MLDIGKIKQAIVLHEECDLETLQVIRQLFCVRKVRHQKLVVPKAVEKKRVVKYSVKQIADAKKLRFKDVSYKEISKVTGVPQGSLSRVLKGFHKVDGVKKQPKNSHNSDAQIRKAWELNQKGVGPKEIARLTGMKRGSCSRPYLKWRLDRMAEKIPKDEEISTY